MGIWGSFRSSLSVKEVGFWLRIHCEASSSKWNEMKCYLRFWRRNCSASFSLPSSYKINSQLRIAIAIFFPFFLSSRLTITFVCSRTSRSTHKKAERRVQREFHLITAFLLCCRVLSSSSSVLAKRLFCRYFINPPNDPELFFFNWSWLKLAWNQLFWSFA